ncbi:hypothetical protein BJ508DRAFT_313110 [Ascobolus immersus RN42]|uniref:Uncharacterized protein n=1 Tax=Ascobolus immersus RN42 TaxID=1160509 RepID=A0A3N4HQY9_ASCIM|nr:hypothetical protein BJ508DRAFT_313110 [Ascobolus immersus RN42]
MSPNGRRSARIGTDTLTRLAKANKVHLAQSHTKERQPYNHPAPSSQDSDASTPAEPGPIPATSLPHHRFHPSDVMLAGDQLKNGELHIERRCSNSVCQYGVRYFTTFHARKWHEEPFEAEDRVMRCMERNCTAWQHEECWEWAIQQNDYPGLALCTSDQYIYGAGPDHPGKDGPKGDMEARTG